MVKSFYCCVLILFSNLAIGQSAKETPYMPGQILIQLQKGYSIENIIENFPKAAKIKVIKELSKYMRFWLIGFDENILSNEMIMQKLKSMHEVRLVQFNHYIEERATVPNDTDFGNQWHHKNTGGTGGTVDADIDSDDAWDITTGGLTSQGDTIVVALIESGGANYSHPDLVSNFWRNYNEISGNGIDDDGNGYIDDFNGWNVGTGNDSHGTGEHGTNVFGMIGARGNNSLGVVGANWICKVMLVSGFGITESDVIAAYDYPLTQRRIYNSTNGANGAFVVSTSSSWGIDAADPASYPLWCAFYDSLGVNGILNVGATTNSNFNVDVVGDMPTACPSNYMISVTRTDFNDNQAGGYGATTIDFGAPGINVYTTSSTSLYTSTTGTSFSCPLTAGVIALMYSVQCNSFMSMVKSNPKDGADYVRSYLLLGADPKPALSGITVTGGRLNSFNSVNAILSNCGSVTCPQPFGLNVSNVTVTSADLSWTDAGTSAGFYYYYRVVGALVWDSVYVTTTTVTLTGLDSCTNYQVKIAADCGSELSLYSGTSTFKTDGCCTPPTAIMVFAVDDSTVNLNFGTVTASTNYIVQFKPASSLVWTTDTISSSPYPITELLPCTTYDLQMQTLCGLTATAFSTPINFTTPGCGACVDLGYCGSNGNFTTDEWIGQVQFSTINRISGDDGGYIFTGLSADLDKNSTYTITVSPAYASTAYTEYFRAWIDYDQNGLFNDTTEVVFDAGATTTSSVSGNFTVPSSATNGPTRMRVSMKYKSSSDNAIPSPCLVFSYGEVEDYCVNIGVFSGVQENMNIAMLNVYPNPAYATLNFDLYNYSEFQNGINNINVFNSFGEKVISHQLYSNNTMLDISELPNGIYSWQIQLQGNVLRTGKIIINK